MFTEASAIARSGSLCILLGRRELRAPFFGNVFLPQTRDKERGRRQAERRPPGSLCLDFQPKFNFGLHKLDACIR